MSIRARVEDAIIMYAVGRPEASLLSLLTAVAATSRRRRPQGTPSTKTPGREMGDGEAFEAFMKDEMPLMCRVVNLNVNFRGELRPLERVLYKWFRCELAHEAELPKDVSFEPDPVPTVKRVECRDDGTLVLSHGWLDALADVMITARENADQFGTPPRPPVPIHLPRIDLTIGESLGDTAPAPTTNPST